MNNSDSYDEGKGFNTAHHQTVEVRGWMKELGVKKHYIMFEGDQVIDV